MKKYKKVFVAGTFDLLHVGHQWMLWTAASLAEEMVIVIARDTTVQALKRKSPVHMEKERLTRVENEGMPNAVVRLGREDRSFLHTLEEEHPDVLYLGYDQRCDESAIRTEFPHIQIIRGEAYFPEVFKSSKVKENH